MPATDPALAPPSTCVMILLTFTRLVVMGYIVLAVLSFLEARELLDNEEFSVQDGTLFVPIVLCLPSSISINGMMFSTSTSTSTTGASASDASASAADDVNCRTLHYLINACMSSLLLSAAAALFWVICDMTARCRSGGCGPLNKHTAAGMGLFLIFLLAQAGISTGALVEQTKYWVDAMESLVEQWKDGVGMDTEGMGMGNGNTTDVITTPGTGTGTMAPATDAANTTVTDTRGDVDVGVGVDVDNNGTNRFLQEGTFDIMEIDTVKAYASMAWLTITFITAFATCLILLVDAVVYSCLYKPRKAMHQAHVQEHQSAAFAMEQQRLSVEQVTQSTVPYGVTANGNGNSGGGNGKADIGTTPTLSGSSSTSSSPMGGTAPTPPAGGEGPADPFPSWTAY